MMNFSVSVKTYDSLVKDYEALVVSEQNTKKTKHHGFQCITRKK